MTARRTDGQTDVRHHTGRLYTNRVASIAIKEFCLVNGGIRWDIAIYDNMRHAWDASHLPVTKPSPSAAYDIYMPSRKRDVCVACYNATMSKE